MKRKMLIYLLSITTLLTTCTTQKNSFEKCIINKTNDLHISKHPYKELEKFEKLLIQEGLINKGDKYNYMAGASKIIEGNENWKKFYNDLKNDEIYNFLKLLRFPFLTICSYDDLSKVDVNKYNRNNLQKYFKEYNISISLKKSNIHYKSLVDISVYDLTSTTMP